MPTDPLRRVETLLVQALERPPENRAEFLSRRCDDEERRAEVESILSAFEEAGGFWDALHDEVAPSLGGWMGSLDEEGDVPTDLLDLEGAEVARYTVQEHIGRGGMGVVYRAWDSQLERSVALKFLPPFLGASPDVKRQFVQEARAAARLEHPNVATIHEIGETEEGRHFIAMTHYDGETLRERLDREGPFEPEVAAEYAKTIAEALHRIHGAGIVHRDVKPANVMMTDQGTMKLLDFGLAADAAGLRLSGRAGRGGTPGYMSPEQAGGGTTGPQTDVWALGVMLYEMLTGERPFACDEPSEVLRVVREENPTPVHVRNTGVSGSLASIVSRCLRKEPTGRYETAEALAENLAPFTFDSETERAVAVLPFTALGEQEEGGFTEGLHTSILSGLRNVSDLQVKVGTSTDDRKGKALSTLAEELGARWVLTGDVWRRKDDIQINAQLVDGRTEENVWAETYCRDLTAENLFDVQDQITQAIAEALKAEVTPGEQERITGTPTRNLDAYRLYAKGRSFLDRRDQEGLVKAVDYFQRVVELDPTYALAWAGLADAVNVFPLFGPDESDPPEIDGEQAARRALELDPDLAEAHTSLGFLQAIPQGIERLRHAIDLKPSYAQAHQWLGLKLLVDGNSEEAYEHASIAAELAPRNRSAQGFLAYHNIVNGRYRDGLKLLEEHGNSFEVEPDWAVEITSRFLFAALYDLGKWEKVKRLVRERQTTVERPEWVTEWAAKEGIAAAALGHEEEARRRVESLPDRPGALFRGLLHVAIGEGARAYEAFEAVETWGYYNVVELRYFYPELLGPFRDTPRFERLIETVEENLVANPTVKL